MTDLGAPVVQTAPPKSPRIQRVRLQRFKRFGEVTISIPEHVVFAGPNNSGKTTVLQAIAAWDLAVRRWMELGDFNARNGYKRQVIERLAFSAIPLVSFDLLFKDRATNQPVVVELTVDGRSIGVEFEYDSPVQLKVRPTWTTSGDNLDWLRQHPVRTTIVPTMSGISREERRYADTAAIDDLLAQGRPGDVLRNLLLIANNNETAWGALTASIKRLFNVELLPPQTGPVLRVEYRPLDGTQRFDIASAGAGFQQILMLLALLHTRTGNVILLDEPDAHLHLFLQDAIYSELRDVAVTSGSQLLIATHSEVLIDAVDPQRLCLMFHTPRLLADNEEKAKLIDSLSALSHSDLMQADSARGVLYVEDYTDMELLRAFARVLAHPALRLLETEVMWKRFKAPLPDGLGDFKPQKHWEMMKLVRPNLPALELLDGDSQNGAQDRVTGDASAMQRLRWRRYEIESYLLHPSGLRRFLQLQLGGEAAAATAVNAMGAAIVNLFGEGFAADPTATNELVENYMRTIKASETTLPAWLHEAGLPEFPKSRFAEIAQTFAPEDVHPEVREKLDQICRAFAVTP
ncbi:MAG: AAA family ATPase [Gammaproteobacteria bacterium]